nr:hypothetical protein [Tanacetum cinerariifolium]
VPQPSGSTDNVADEVVHKELGDSLVTAATIASSLKVEKDSGNINNTQSKATPNEPSSYETNSGGGPRVLDLEKTNTTQSNEIASLKKRVKKLEKNNRSRTHKLKRLYKVGLTARVESSDEESLGENASKQGRRIDDIDQDEDIALVNVQDDAEMFNVDDLGGEEVFIIEQEVVSTTATTVTTEELTLGQALEALKTLKPKVKGIVIQEQEKPGKSTTTTAAISKQQSQDKGKGIMIEEPDDIQEKIASTRTRRVVWCRKGYIICTTLREKKKALCSKNSKREKEQTTNTSSKEKITYNYFKNMEGYTLKQLKLKEFDEIQEMFDKAFRRDSTKKQKVEDDKETAELKQLMEIIPDKEVVAIDAIPLVVKSPRIIN